MLLSSLLTSGLVLFGSFAMRTPNQPDIINDDYEISMGVKNSFLYVNKQWERELGNYFVDDIVWLLYDNNNLYIKPEYFNKQSKDIKYLKIDYRWKRKETGWSYGFTSRTLDNSINVKNGIETLYSLGYDNKYGVGTNIDIHTSFSGYYGKFFEYEEIFKITYKVLDTIYIYNTGEFYKLRHRSFYKARIGFEISF